jgi:hypothetical protein
LYASAKEINSGTTQMNDASAEINDFLMFDRHIAIIIFQIIATHQITLSI